MRPHYSPSSIGLFRINNSPFQFICHYASLLCIKRSINNLTIITQQLIWSNIGTRTIRIILIDDIKISCRAKKWNKKMECREYIKKWRLVYCKKKKKNKKELDRIEECLWIKENKFLKVKIVSSLSFTWREKK